MWSSEKAVWDMKSHPDLTVTRNSPGIQGEAGGGPGGLQGIRTGTCKAWTLKWQLVYRKLSLLTLLGAPSKRDTLH